jgi:hypothetical protein
MGSEIKLIDFLEKSSQLKEGKVTQRKALSKVSEFRFEIRGKRPEYILGD